MLTINGEMTIQLDALGHRRGDSRILAAIVLVGPRMEISEFTSGEQISRHYLFKPAGTELLFENDILVSVMVRTRPDPDDTTYGTYPRPSALIEGLSPTATRAEVMAFLGNPQRMGRTFYLYDVNQHHLHFEFDQQGQTAKISALLQGTFS